RRAPACGRATQVGLMHGQRLDDLRADRLDGVQGAGGVLQDQCDLLAPDRPELAVAQLGDVPAAEHDLALHDTPGRLDQAEDGERARSLARAGLAPHPDPFGRAKVEGDGAHGVAPRLASVVDGAQVAHRQGELVHQAVATVGMRTRGSITAESRSTARLTSTNITALSRMKVCTIAKSCLVIASNTSEPTPGQLKTRSIRTLPARNSPSTRPPAVRVGRKALGRAWRRKAVQRRRPLPRATVMKGSREPSSRLARSSLTRKEKEEMPRASPGRIRCRKACQKVPSCPASRASTVYIRVTAGGGMAWTPRRPSGPGRMCRVLKNTISRSRARKKGGVPKPR